MQELHVGNFDQAVYFNICGDFNHSFFFWCETTWFHYTGICFATVYTEFERLLVSH